MRTTLMDFMNQHPSMVEDLYIASAHLPKGYSILAASLRKYADELKKDDPMYMARWVNPFIENLSELYVLEYQESSGIFHYNSSFENGVFRQPLYSNGYFPIAVIPADLTDDKAFVNLLDGLHQKKVEFIEAAEKIRAFLKEA